MSVGEVIGIILILLFMVGFSYFLGMGLQKRKNKLLVWLGSW